LQGPKLLEDAYTKVYKEKSWVFAEHSENILVYTSTYINLGEIFYLTLLLLQYGIIKKNFLICF